MVVGLSRTKSYYDGEALERKTEAGFGLFFTG